MGNYEDHEWVLDQLVKAQSADEDNRERAREAKLFISKRDGQWEQDIAHRNDGKPRYTFDQVSPVIDQIVGAMDRNDFDIRIEPSGGKATKETAKTFDGLARHIDKISGAETIYGRAGRGMVISGLDGWRVVQKYTDSDSFDQDLVIEKVSNFIERVWFGPHEEPDASDADYCWVLTGLTKSQFEKEYPEHSEASIDQSRKTTAYFNRPDLIMVGEFLYLKDETRELALMSDGSVIEVDDGFDAVVDEMAAAGLTEVSRRTRQKRVVYSRLFSNDVWLTEPRETVFENWIPVIPCYANFDIIEDKVTYWGAVEKLIDPQRVFNYSISREIEEGALAPRQKYWMTEKQATGYEDTLATLNTNSDPVQFFNPDERLPGPPMQTGGAQINPGLRTISETMQAIIGHSAGMFAANMGDNPGLQSGVAIDMLQDRGDTGSNKYLASRETAQRHTARILVNAMARVYEPDRQVRLLREDGSMEMATIGQRVLDEQTGRTYVINDLSAGTYDVECRSGPNYKSRQNESVEAIVKVAQIDPSIIEVGSDILLGNIPAPGMDDLAARKRQQLFQAGMIPVDQMSEEEQAQLQQMQNQPPQEDPNMVLARAEEAKAQAEMANAQTKQADAQIKAQAEAQRLAIQEFEAQTKRIEAETKRLLAEFEASKKGAETAKTTAEAEAKEMENFEKFVQPEFAQPVAAAPYYMEEVPSSSLEQLITTSELSNL